MNYKSNRKLITLQCDLCNITYEKPVSEYNRNQLLNRKSYCSRSCCGKSISNIKHLLNISSNYDISQHSNNLTDEYTGFRYYLRNSKKRNKESDLTLDDIKDQWNLQQGICPYTNLKLVLFKAYSKTPYQLRASLDRIDSSLGYIKGNIEFISLPINYLKNNQFTKQQTIDFLTKTNFNFR